MNKTRLNVKYEGHRAKKNQSVDLNLSYQYECLPKIVVLLHGLNVDVEVAIKQEEKVVKLGIFRIYKVEVSHDGSGVIVLNSLSDYISFEVLGFMSTLTDEDIDIFFKWELEGDTDE